MSGWFTIVSATSPTQTYSLSPSFGSAGIVTTLSPIFSVCGSNAPVGECTEDRFDTYEWIENGSNVVTQTAPGGTNGAETFQIRPPLGQGLMTHRAEQFRHNGNYVFVGSVHGYSRRHFL